MVHELEGVVKGGGDSVLRAYLRNRLPACGRLLSVSAAICTPVPISTA